MYWTGSLIAPSSITSPLFCNENTSYLPVNIATYYVVHGATGQAYRVSFDLDNGQCAINNIDGTTIAAGSVIYFNNLSYPCQL